MLRSKASLDPAITITPLQGEEVLGTGATRPPSCPPRLDRLSAMTVPLGSVTPQSPRAAEVPPDQSLTAKRRATRGVTRRRWCPRRRHFEGRERAAASGKRRIAPAR
jgi:hypothetical protein